MEISQPESPIRLSHLQLFSRTVERCAYVFKEAPTTVFQELHNRIATHAVEDPLLCGMLKQARQHRRAPWLRCLLGSLEVPGLVRVLTGHTASVTDCNFSPDGTRLVSAGADGALRVWDASSGELLRAIKLPCESAWECEFTADGTHLLARAGGESSESCKLVLVDPASGFVVATSKVDVQNLWQCAVSKSGELLAMPGGDFCIEIVAVDCGSVVSLLDGHSDVILACAFNSEGSILLSLGQDGRILTWEMPGGRLLNEVLWDGRNVKTCRFSPDLTHFVSGGTDGHVDLWRSIDGFHAAGVQGHEGIVFRCFYTRDGSAIFSQGGSNDLKFWDSATLASIGSFDDFGHAAPDSMSPDGKTVVTSGIAADYTAYLWNARTGECETSLAAHTYELEACRFSPDGRHIVTASCDWTLLQWDVAAALQASPGKRAEGGSVVTFSPDSERLLSEHFGEGRFKVWQSSDGKLLLDIQAHEKYICDSCFSPDGRFLATTGVEEKGATLKVWDSQTGRELCRAEVSYGWPEGCAFSEDGRHILWQPERYGVTKSVSANSGVVRASIENHKFASLLHPFSPDGRAVLRGDSRNSPEDIPSWERGDALVFWNLITGREDVIVDDGTHGWGHAISPDGKALCIADRQRLRLIDIASGRELATVDDEAPLCQYSPDARFLMSVNSPDPNARERVQILQLRDSQTLALYRTLSFRISEDGTGKSGFSPDGRLVYWSSDERVVIFDLAHSRQYFFRDKAGGMNGVSFCLDGTRFAVGNGRGEVIVFALEFADPGAPASTAIAIADSLILRCAWCAAENGLSPTQLGTVVRCQHCGRANAVNPTTRQFSDPDLIVV
jgi:WD40 repeat protein